MPAADCDALSVRVSAGDVVSVALTDGDRLAETHEDTESEPC